MYVNETGASRYMKPIKKPTQAMIADALCIDPAMVTRYKRQGMPVHSIEAAKAWRDVNVRMRVNPQASSEALRRAMQGEQAASRAGSLLQAAGALLGNGGDVANLIETLRRAMCAVPVAQRPMVLFPSNVMDVLTEDVARELDRGDPLGLIHGAMPLPQVCTTAEGLDMGAFWYAVAAGEVFVKRNEA